MNKKIKIIIVATMLVIAVIIGILANLIVNGKKEGGLTPKKRAEQVEEKTVFWMADCIINGKVKKDSSFIKELEAEGLLTQEETQELLKKGETQIGSKAIEIKNINLESYIEVDTEDGEFIRLKPVNTEIFKQYGIEKAEITVVHPDMETLEKMNLLDDNAEIKYPINENILYTFKIAPVNGQSADDIEDIKIMVKNNN